MPKRCPKDSGKESFAVEIYPGFKPVQPLSWFSCNSHSVRNAPAHVTMALQAAGWSLPPTRKRGRGRKVRTPQGSVPD